MEGNIFVLKQSKLWYIHCSMGITIFESTPVYIIFLFQSAPLDWTIGLAGSKTFASPTWTPRQRSQVTTKEPSLRRRAASPIVRLEFEGFPAQMEVGKAGMPGGCSKLWWLNFHEMCIPGNMMKHDSTGREWGTIYSNDMPISVSDTLGITQCSLSCQKNITYGLPHLPSGSSKPSDLEVVLIAMWTWLNFVARMDPQNCPNIPNVGMHAGMPIWWNIQIFCQFPSMSSHFHGFQPVEIPISLTSPTAPPTQHYILINH